MADIWNGLLDGLGTTLSFFYDLIPSYGFAIILLTIAVRVVLLPLTIKQTRSMQAMQKIQPMVKALQQKYKGNRQKINEELMKLYKEHRVNPLGGCLPLILQLPVFFALFRVLTAPAALVGSLPGTRYLPEGGSLLAAINEGTATFLGMNLACSPTRAGRGLVAIVEGAPRVDCGGDLMAAIPFYFLVLLMVVTTWYQQRQMQRASAGPQAAQMRIMGRIMPIFLGVISVSIAAGVLVYWATTNLWQVGQQYLMLRSRVGGEAKPSESGDGKVKAKEIRAGPASAKPEQPQKAARDGNQSQKRSGRRARSRKKRRKR